MREFRRVVTGHDENGKAIVVSDETATHILERPNRPGVRLTNFWKTNSTPAEYDGDPETCEGPFILHPPKHGSVFRCVEFLPEDPEVMAAKSEPKRNAEERAEIQDKLKRAKTARAEAQVKAANGAAAAAASMPAKKSNG